MSELDLALSRLHQSGFEYADDVPNYGPMAAEALEALRHAALTSGLVDVYVPRLPPLVEAPPLAASELAAARGNFTKAGAWLAYYEQVLGEKPWADVLCEALEAALDHGTSAPGMHGLVRIGHAVRGLEQDDTPVRRRELAFGLAYASARVGRAATQAGDDESVNDAAPVGEALSAVCLEGARLYLANPSRRLEAALGVIAPSALRLLVGHLPRETSKSLLRAVLANLVVLGVSDDIELDAAPDPEIERCAESLNETRYRAACSIHEHAILMAEACLREDATAPDRLLRLAAADAAL
ncbi:MAG: hypothetical protein ACI8W3_002985, partial [Myxococcota bacterium]